MTVKISDLYWEHEFRAETQRALALATELRRLARLAQDKDARRIVYKKARHAVQRARVCKILGDGAADKGRIQKVAA